MASVHFLSHRNFSGTGIWFGSLDVYFYPYSLKLMVDVYDSILKVDVLKRQPAELRYSHSGVEKGGADKFLDLRLKEEDSPIPRQILYLPNQYTQNTRQSAYLFPEQHSPSTLLVMKTYNQLP